MALERIIVPFRGSSLSLGREEARRLKNELEQKLAASSESDELIHPKVNEGYLNRAACHEFFAQIYANEIALRRHASNLYSIIVNNVRWKTGLRIRLRCIQCHETDLKSRACRGQTDHSMLFNDTSFAEIEVASLLELPVELFSSLRMVGPSTLEDFNILREHLK